MNTFAAAMPGKMGDALYALPTIRKLYKNTGLKCDFYTSSYCEPLRSLLLYQECINAFIIPDTYQVKSMDCGCQPWYMPIDESKYEFTIQFGFRSVPDRPLHEFMGMYAGIHEPMKIEYEFPEKVFLHHPYICVAPRGDTGYNNLFDGVIEASPIPVAVIGAKNDYRGIGNDCTGLSMLHTVSMLAKAQGFLGLMSSQLVLANAFNYPKIAPHDGHSWDMRHVINSGSNFYPVNPNVEDVLNILFPKERALP